MSIFEDTVELWQNALEDDDVATVTGPASMETLQTAHDRIEELGNEPRDGCFVISIDMAREISRGWVEIEHDTVPDGHEEFRPFDNMITVTDAVRSEHAMIVRSDAVRLDMAVLEDDGVVAIDFDRGDTTDV